MKSPITNDDQSICPCGKIGYATPGEAEGVAKLLRKKRRPNRTGGRAYKDPRADALRHYQCRMTGSGLWHIGHGSREAS